MNWLEGASRLADEVLDALRVFEETACLKRGIDSTRKSVLVTQVVARALAKKKGDDYPKKTTVGSCVFHRTSSGVSAMTTVEHSLLRVDGVVVDLIAATLGKGCQSSHPVIYWPDDGEEEPHPDGTGTYGPCLERESARQDEKTRVYELEEVLEETVFGDFVFGDVYETREKVLLTTVREAMDRF